MCIQCMAWWNWFSISFEVMKSYLNQAPKVKYSPFTPSCPDPSFNVVITMCSEDVEQNIKARELI